MNAQQKIIHFTGMVPVEVQEWASVYWVKFAGRRPTMFSKKIVNRAAEIEVRNLNGDKAARDNRTGKIYILRQNWQMGYTLKELAKGQQITPYSDFAMVRGEIVASVSYVSRPQKVSEIIAHLAKNAA